MQTFIKSTAVTLAGLAVGLGSTAFAAQYPIAPPGNTVSLGLESFIQDVPLSGGILDPSVIIGDHLGQHPGGFNIGFPNQGSFFVGVFGAPIDTTSPGTAVYLWETSGGSGGGSFPGPQVQLGFWDGLNFIPAGQPLAAEYSETGARGDDPFMGINSSATPLSDFGIMPGDFLNAVRVEAADMTAHNQVTALAVGVPEPTGLYLCGPVLACAVGYAWRKWRRA